METLLTFNKLSLIVYKQWDHYHNQSVDVFRIWYNGKKLLRCTNKRFALESFESFKEKYYGTTQET